ncbi:uncharacterized protein LOC123523372 [Mercenaria mercenaria]|uniref:uncharacterized protein LOC123523372 n=1 Tax=Mercenaria mercenaria TaxID=6596 RepID=UPI00234E6E72|nr:uncharacterized protein LOC123523372 [Mercenaria mercenaria]
MFIPGFVEEMDLKVADLLLQSALLVVCICVTGLAASTSNDWHFDGQNIAFHKNVSQLPETYCDDDQSHKCYPASLAVDGNTDGYFKHGSCSHTIGNTSVDASWTVDLGKSVNVTGIVIYNRDGK